MMALQAMAINTDMACITKRLYVRDTGMPTFEIKHRLAQNQILMQKEIKEAIVEATKIGKLRPNAVDSLTGKKQREIISEMVSGDAFLRNGRKKKLKCD